MIKDNDPYQTPFSYYEKIIDAFIKKDAEDMKWILVGQNMSRLEFFQELRNNYKISMKKSLDNWSKYEDKVNRLVEDEKVDLGIV